jgi:hypothetical protein
MVRLEGVAFRSYLLGFILIVAAIVFYSFPVSMGKAKSLSWLEQNTPIQVKDFRFVPSNANPKASYQLNEMVYATLIPDAILGRIYQSQKESYDVLALLSRKRDSFHDQRICFSSQGWTIERFDKEFVKTRLVGTVPVTMIRMHSAEEKNKLAVLFYKGPNRYYENAEQFKLGMIWEKLIGTPNVEGTFFRIIANSPTTTEKGLRSFVADYLDEAHRVSNGYY